MIQLQNSERVRDYDRRLLYGRAMYIALRRSMWRAEFVDGSVARRLENMYRQRTRMKRVLRSRTFIVFACSELGRRIINESINGRSLKGLFGPLPEDLRD